MAAYIDQYDNAKDNRFQQRVRVALMNQAKTVAHTLNGVTTPTAQQTAEGKLIANVMAATNQYADLFSIAIVCSYGCVGGDPTATGADTDAAVQSAVASAWSDFAAYV